MWYNVFLGGEAISIYIWVKDKKMPSHHSHCYVGEQILCFDPNQMTRNNFIYLTSPLMQNMTQGLFLCREPIYVYMDEWQKLLIMLVLTLHWSPPLSAIRKVLQQSWNTRQLLPSKMWRTDTTLWKTDKWFYLPKFPIKAGCDTRSFLCGQPVYVNLS